MIKPELSYHGNKSVQTPFCLFIAAEFQVPTNSISGLESTLANILNVVVKGSI